MDFKTLHRIPIFSQVRHISGIALLFLLEGCLDIPDTPEPKAVASSVAIYAVQEGQADSAILKIRPESKATLKAAVFPKELVSELDFSWYRDSLLGTGPIFDVPAYSANDSIPDKLIVKDSEGNTISLDFKVTVNSPPIFSDSFYPAQGDTLFGSSRTAFTFSWKAEDNEDESLDYIVELDTTSYLVGTLEKIQQSGFYPGLHLFRVIAMDSEGDSDTLPLVKFYVVDTLETAK